MNLQDLVNYAQERSRTPDRSVGFPEPNWIPVHEVERTLRTLLERDNETEAGVSDAGREDNRVQVVNEGDTLGIEVERDDLQPPSGGPGEAEIEHQGTDALAFYLPFHYYRSVWGIYLRASGIHYLAQKLKRAPLGPADERILQAAATVLHAHERHHFAVEAATTLLEVGLLDGIYKLQFDDGTARQIEEALSNARCRLALWHSEAKTLLPVLDGFMESQGPGYRDFHLYRSPKKFSGGRRELGKRICSVWRTDQSNIKHPIGLFHALLHTPWPWEAYHEAVDVIGRRWDIPCYLIMDVPVPWLRVQRPFRKDMGIQVFVYSNDHRPVHFHLSMPPGEPYGRYLWPSLEPVGRKDPSLSNKVRRTLAAYLNKYGSDIRRELCQVYGSVAVGTLN